MHGPRPAQLSSLIPFPFLFLFNSVTLAYFLFIPPAKHLYLLFPSYWRLFSFQLVYFTLSSHLSSIVLSLHFSSYVFREVIDPNSPPICLHSPICHPTQYLPQPWFYFSILLLIFRCQLIWNISSSWYFTTLSSLNF